jgi:O-antigen ligase
MVMDPSGAEAAAEESPTAASRAAADFRDIQRRTEEIWRYLRYLLSLKKERILRSTRRTLWLVAGGIIALAISFSVLSTAAVLVCVGIALGLNRAFDSIWIGPFVTGVGIIALVAGAFVVATRIIEKKAAEALKRRYEVERAELKLRYGRGFDELESRSSRH